MDTAVNLALALPNESRIAIILLAYFVVASTLFIGLLRYFTESAANKLDIPNSNSDKWKLGSNNHTYDPLGDRLKSDPLSVRRHLGGVSISWTLPIEKHGPGTPTCNIAKRFNAALKIRVESVPHLHGTHDVVTVFRRCPTQTTKSSKLEWERVTSVEGSGLDSLSDTIQIIERNLQAQLRKQALKTYFRIELDQPLDVSERTQGWAGWELRDNSRVSADRTSLYRVVVVALDDEYLGNKHEVHVLHRVDVLDGPQEPWVRLAVFPGSSLRALFSAVKFAALDVEHRIIASKQRTVCKRS